MTGAVLAAAAALVAALAVLLALNPKRAPLAGLEWESPAAEPMPRALDLSTTSQAALIVGAVGLATLLPLRRALLAVVLTVVVLAVVRAAARRRAEAVAAERRQRVVLYAEALVGELAAGMPVSTALERATDVWDEAAVVAAASRWGASVPEALRDLGRRPGAESVVRLGAVWQLCAGSGASLAVGVRHVLETARAEQSTKHVVAAELASARATARMLGVMPVMVLVAGQGLGAEPWAFLLDSLAGIICLAAGAACALAGLAWMDRIAADAVRGPR